jgi:gamma-glutamyltranspeptidase/glutathione hydrolase
VPDSAAIAMPDAQSAEITSAILAAGGNAVDAAVAAGFALAVSEPEAGNIGGGGFMLIFIDGEAHFLDYRETAPLAADRDMYLDINGDVIKDASRVGHLAVGVPGSVAGLYAAHEKFGQLPWKDVVMPAVELARSGFPVHADLASNINRGIGKFEGRTNFGNFFTPLEEGDLLVQAELADTLERIANDGADGFYRGKTADLIVAEMERGGGLITHQDLDAYEAIWREPLRAEWREFEVLSAPPPSSGGFAVIQLLKMKDLLASEFEGLELNSPQYVHLIAEIEKRVFADRAEYLGDPDFAEVPLETLLSDTYLESRAREVNPDAITPVDDVFPGLDSWDTTHYSVIDANGNAVSTTTTLNLSFGSGVVVEGAGFLLNDEMDDFSAKPGVPNAFGVIGNVANEIQPGKRMLSSMSPTILLRDGTVNTVVGTPGGSTIFTSVFQTIVNLVDFDKTPLEAIGVSRFHHQLLPADVIIYNRGVPLGTEAVSDADEAAPPQVDGVAPVDPDDDSVTRLDETAPSDLDDAVLLELSERGYRMLPRRFGDIQVITRDGDTWAPASDPRNRGKSQVLD